MRRVPLPDEVDWKIAATRGFGWTVAQQATFADVSDSTVNSRVNAAPLFYAQWVPVFALLKRENAVISGEVHAGNVRKEVEKLLGPSMKALESAVNSGKPALALRAAKEVLDRVLGKSTQKSVNVNMLTGSVEHVHRHQPPAAVQGRMDQMIEAGLVPPLEVLEGDLVGERPMLSAGSDIPADA